MQRAHRIDVRETASSTDIPKPLSAIGSARFGESETGPGIPDFKQAKAEYGKLQ
jgi:hypothetical protein